MKGLFTHHADKKGKYALFDGKNYWELKLLEKKYADMDIKNMLMEDIKFSSYDEIADREDFYNSLSLEKTAEVENCDIRFYIYTVNGQTACMRYCSVPCFDSSDYEYDGDYMLFFIAGEKQGQVDGLIYRGGYRVGYMYYCNNLIEAPEYIIEELKKQNISSLGLSGIF